MENEKFTSLIKKAMGDKTQAQFAKELGVGQSQISRFLSGANHPQIMTLEKIAKASEGAVSIEDLLQACDYSIEEYQTKKEAERNNSPDHERARSEIKEILEGLRNFSGQKWNSLDDMFDTILLLYSGEKTTLKSGFEHKCPECVDSNAENCILLTGTTSFSENEAIFYILLTYNKTVSGCVIPSKAFSDAEAILKSQTFPKDIPVPAELADIEEMFAIRPISGYSKEEQDAIRNNLEKLIGDEGDKYIGAAIGTGFVLPESPNMNILSAFVETHRANILKTSEPIIDEYLAGNTDAAKNIVSRESGFAGWGAIIANVILNETGLAASYWTQDYGQNNFEFAHNPACIIIPDDDKVFTEKGTKYVLDKLEPYARELGIRIIGTCYFQTIFDKNKGEYRYIEGI